MSLLNIEINKLNLLRAKADFLPTLNAFTSHGYNFGRTLDPLSNEFATDRVRSNSFSLNSSFTVFEGFLKSTKLKQEQLNQKAGMYDSDQIRNDVTLSVASAFLQILFDQELLDIAREQLEISRQQKEHTQLLVDAGKLAQGDLLDIKSQYASEELNVTNAQNALDIATLTLKQLLYLPSDQEFSIIRPVLNFNTTQNLLLSSDVVFQTASEVQPSVLAAETRVQVAEKTISIAKSGMFPRINVSASYGTGYSDLRTEITDMQVDGYDTIGITSDGASVLTPSYNIATQPIKFYDQLDNNVSQSVNFSMNIPIFNGLATRTSVSKAKIGLESAMLDLENTKDKLEKTIQQAYADAKAALAKYRSTKDQTEAMEESFKYAQKKFDVGMITAVDYNDAKNKLTKSKSDLLQAKYEFVFNTKVLDFYMGKPIDF